MTDETKGVFIPSKVWIDQADAFERLTEKTERGDISPEVAIGLAQFIEKGYLCVESQPMIGDDALDEIQSTVDELWRSRPRDVLYAYDGPTRRMTEANGARERRPRYRIHDLHSKSRAALDLYLNASLFDIVEQLFGEPAIAIQSLFFEYGSEQELHRDATVIPTEEPGHLVGAWIALEDIHPDAGPLTYVPGSHRLPCYETDPGRYMFDAARMGPDLVRAGLAWEAHQERRNGLEMTPFAAKRGQILLWHASLRHGGSVVADENRSRRSLIIHFSTRRTYRRRAITVAERRPHGEEPVILETEEIVARNGRNGLASPAVSQPHL